MAMTHNQRNWLKTWLPAVSVVLALILQIVLASRWVERIEGRLASVERHAQSTAIHMPMTEKLDLFVTRRESERADVEIRTMLLKIEGKIDYLYRRAQGPTSATSTP